MSNTPFAQLTDPRDEYVTPMGDIRTFSTGATRDTEQGKLDYEAFLSPIVLRRYAQYMHSQRIQPDGQLRDGDNWQKGIPRDAYMKSGARHFMDWWIAHRTKEPNEDAICALLFNAMGYLHTLLTDYEGT